jgi:hypothetical protein
MQIHLAMLQLVSATTTGITAEEAMQNYDSMVREPIIRQEICPKVAEEEIVVCAKRARQTPRLPLPDERRELGEVAGSRSEAPSAKAIIMPPPAAPSRLPETIGKVVNAIRSAISGHDN